MEDLIEVDRTLFLPLPRLNRFSMLRTAEQIHAIERDYDVSIGDLRQHVEVIRQVCRDWKEAQVAGVKMSQSYHRRMDFKARDAGQAAVIFGPSVAGRLRWARFGRRRITRGLSGLPVLSGRRRSRSDCPVSPRHASRQQWGHGGV